jgi:N-acetyl-1-D-myo-inositol-2-amino-2-deoxy-alpha-D-glucopyranoside deacetylase
VAHADFDALRAAGSVNGFTPAPAFEEIPAHVDDAAIAVAIDTTANATASGGPTAFERKLAALRAHATQLTVDGTHFALTNMLRQRVSRVEYYRLADDLTGAGSPCALTPCAAADDLFAGLDVY